MPSGSARVAITAIGLRQRVRVDHVHAGSWLLDERRASVIASAAAVPSSSMLALAMASPVRSVTMVWKLSSASSRPWLISGWYGVYAVYQAGLSSTLRRITPGRVRAVVAQADHRDGDRVPVGERAQLGQHLGLGRGRRQVERAVPADDLRDGGVHQLLDRAVADRRRASGAARPGWGRCAGPAKGTP